MRIGTNTRSNATDPTCTVVGEVGVTSSASSVPIICSCRIAIATLLRAARLQTVVMTTPIITNSK